MLLCADPRVVIGGEAWVLVLAAKLADALLVVAQEESPPRRWIAGVDAVAAIEQKANELLAQADAYRELTSNLAHDDA